MGLGRNIGLGASTACLLSVAGLPSVADDFEWTGGAANGVWNDALNWVNTTVGGTDADGIPDADDGVSFLIDAASTNGAAQTLNTAAGATFSAGVGNLSLGAGTYVNDGTITFTSAGTTADNNIFIGGAATLGGGGEFVFLDNDSRLLNAGGGSLTNGANHTIRAGVGGFTNLGINNLGTVLVPAGTTLSAPSITGGTLDIDADGRLAGGTALTDVTVVGTLKLLPGTHTLSGTITTDGTLGFAGQSTTADEIYGLGSAVALAGSGELVFLDADSRVIDQGGGSLTVGSGFTLRGGNGGSTGVAVDNDGLIRVDAGVLTFTTIDNTGGAIEIAATGELRNAGVTGGTVSADAGAAMRNGSLIGVDLSGELAIALGTTTVSGTLNNSGTLTFTSEASVADNTLAVNAPLILAGSGELVFVDADSRVVDAGGGTLTNGADHTIRAGAGGSTNLPINNLGTVVLPAGSDFAAPSITGGVLDIDPTAQLAAGTTLTDLTLLGTHTQGIGTTPLVGTITTDGTLTFGSFTSVADQNYAIGSAVNLAGNGEVVMIDVDSRIIDQGGGQLTLGAGFTLRGTGFSNVATVNNGLIRAEGGSLNLAVVDNAAGRIEVAADGILNTAQVTGGELSAADGALLTGGSLTDVDFDGTIALTIGTNNLGGTVTNNGTLTFTSDVSNADHNFAVGSAVTLAGTGQLVLLDKDSRLVDLGGGVLTNGANHTIRGNDGGANVHIINDGTISPGAADGQTGSIDLAALTLKPTGSLPFEIGGTVAGDEYDQILSASVTMAGDVPLELSLINGFSPEFYDEFLIMQSTSLDQPFVDIDSFIDTLFGGDRRVAVTYGPSEVGAGILSEVLVTAALPGDANLDQAIAQADLDAVLLNWGSLNAAWATGDLTGDGFVSQADLDQVLLNWGDTVPPALTPQLTAVPEPASVLLLGLGGAALLTRRRH